MSKAIILQQVEYERPARIVPVLRDFGIPIEIRRLWRGDQVPADPDDVRLLVVLGGPMGVGDIGKPQYPFLSAEVDLLKKMIEADRPVLGICLGAQLLAHAAGAKVGPNVKPGPTPDSPPIPVPEIGWGPITLPFPGGTEPVMMGVPEGAMMFHWHFDTFELPKMPPPPGAPPATPPPAGSVLMASTAACRNQAFRFRDRLFGFQFHFEMDEAGIEAMLAARPQDVAAVLGPDGAERIRQDTRRYYSRHERLGNRILRNFVQFLKLY